MFDDISLRLLVIDLLSCNVVKLKFSIRFFGQSREECEYLIHLAKPHMLKSTVVDSTTGKSTDSRCGFPSSFCLFYIHLYLLLPGVICYTFCIQGTNEFRNISG